MVRNDTLSTIQRKAIACLLTERNVSTAAIRAGTTPNTLFKWLTKPNFREALTAAESQAIDESVRSLVRISGTAVDTLETTMKDPLASHAARVRSAQAVLDSLLKLREYRSLEERVTRLEEIENERFTK